MKQELSIKVQNSKIVLKGSIEAIHPIPQGYDPQHPLDITINLSDGTILYLRHQAKFDQWEITHNRIEEVNTKMTKIPAREYGDSDEIKFDYAISVAEINIPVTQSFVGGSTIEVTTYGEHLLTKDQKKVFESLVHYLQDRGFLCVEEIKKDLRMIISGRV